MLGELDQGITIKPEGSEIAASEADRQPTICCMMFVVVLRVFCHCLPSMVTITITQMSIKKRMG